MSAPNETSSRWPRRALLTFLALAPVWAVLLFRTNIFVAIVPLFLSHLLFCYATLAPQCEWWGPIASSFSTSRREVWITIDDGPSPAHTPKILEILERHGARATFFVIGKRTQEYPDLVEEIVRRGHELANHTFAHRSSTFWCSSSGRVAAEIDRCAQVLENSVAKSSALFRAPAGIKNPFVHPALARRKMFLVGWTVRGLDTVLRDASNVAARIFKNVRPGAIILLHEGHRIERDPDFNLRCLELTLRGLTERGYRFVIPQLSHANAGTRST
jgi:peptidoglycan-N-acetylglucosamine deacetylase